ncbi:MAG: hypothetical protein LBE38_05715 [Deltaproteobacteria bacterium]|nr:hypothetical protein [Deltaproteobacteria bacterium]
MSRRSILNGGPERTDFNPPMPKWTRICELLVNKGYYCQKLPRKATSNVSPQVQ